MTEATRIAVDCTGRDEQYCTESALTGGPRSPLAGERERAVNA
jgi:hypothetical protein